MAGPNENQPMNPQGGPSKERDPLGPQIPLSETTIAGSGWANLHRRRLLHTLLTHPSGHHRHNGNHRR